MIHGIFGLNNKLAVVIINSVGVYQRGVDKGRIHKSVVSADYSVHNSKIYSCAVYILHIPVIKHCFSFAILIEIIFKIIHFLPPSNKILKANKLRLHIKIISFIFFSHNVMSANHIQTVTLTNNHNLHLCNG